MQIGIVMSLSIILPSSKCCDAYDSNHAIQYNNILFSPSTDDVLEQHHVSGIGHAPSTASTREPNLNDVIDYLSSPNPSNVANAAAYLQHLAYGDDSMKAKIRWEGHVLLIILYICVF